MRYLMILCMLVLAACSKKEAEPVDATAAEAANTQTPAEAEGPSEASAVAEQAVEFQADWGELGVTSLLTPGKAPLGKLRRTFKKGETARVELLLTADRGMDTKLGTPLPPLGARYLVTFQTESVSPDGSKAKVAFTMNEATAIGQDDDPTAAESFAALEGLQGSYAVDQHGVLTDLELIPPEGAHTQTANASKSVVRLQSILSIPIPAEEVGVGARWSSVWSPQPSKGLLHRTTYELTKIKGSKVEVSMSVELGSTKPELEGTIKWLGAWGTGKGEASFDLGGVLPVQANMHILRNDKYYVIGRGPTVSELRYDYKLTTK